MIKVNYDQTLFGNIMWNLDCYSAYSNLFLTEQKINPFIKDINGIPVYLYYDIPSIQNSKSDVIIIDLLTEGYHVTDRFADYPKNKSYILCSNGWWDPTIDLGFEYYLLYYNYFLYDYAMRMLDYRTLDYFQEKDYDFDSQKPYLFCSLIGSSRPLRSYLVNKITQTIIDKNYILNYAGQEYGASSRKLDIKYDFSKYDSYIPNYKHYNISSSIPLAIYNSSKVNLIVESSQCDEFDEFHLTEKTVKAIISGIPFIIYGSYKFLEKLRNLGFKTFNSIWSEEYDQIQNANQRADAIVSLLLHINNMTWDKDTIKQLQEITNYNKIILRNVNVIMKKQLDKIIKDLEHFSI